MSITRKVTFPGQLHKKWMIFWTLTTPSRKQTWAVGSFFIKIVSSVTYLVYQTNMRALKQTKLRVTSRAVLIKHLMTSFVCPISRSNWDDNDFRRQKKLTMFWRCLNLKRFEHMEKYIDNNLELIFSNRYKSWNFIQNVTLLSFCCVIKRRK